MRKNFKYKIVGLALLIVSVLSCDTADQDVSPIVEPDDSYPLVTYTLETSGTLSEGDTIVYTITTNKPISQALPFNIRVDTALSTVDELDYTVVPGVIQPWTTEAQLSIITNWDITPESDEVLAFEIGLYSLAVKYLIHPSNVNPTASFTINNYTSDEVTVEFLWDFGLDLFGDGGLYSTGTYVDFDMFMSDGATYDASDPWASWIYLGYPAATGNHPEVIDLTGFDDGSYVFFFDLWANVFWGYGNTTDVPVTSHIYQPGVFDIYVDQDPDAVINANTPGYANDGTESNGTLLKVVVSGGVFTISDYSDVVVSGKSVSSRTPRPTIIRK